MFKEEQNESLFLHRTNLPPGKEVLATPVPAQPQVQAESTRLRRTGRGHREENKISGKKTGG